MTPTMAARRRCGRPEMTQPLMTVTHAAAELGMFTRSGRPARRSLHEHIRTRGPEINGITFAVQINGRWHCLPEAIERIKNGERNDETHAA